MIENCTIKKNNFTIFKIRMSVKQVSTRSRRIVPGTNWLTHQMQFLLYVGKSLVYV